MMKADGHSVIFISHKLNEIMDICDRVTVLRKGRIVGGTQTKDTDKMGLARMMVGKDVALSMNREKLPKGERVLSVQNIHVTGDKGLAAVKNVSFDVYKNEILGVAGVAGTDSGSWPKPSQVSEPLMQAGSRSTAGTLPICPPKRFMTTGYPMSPRNASGSHCAGPFLYDNAILKQHHLKKFS